MTFRSRSIPVTGALLAATIALASCTSTSGEPDGPLGSDESSTSTSDLADYPKTIENCGTEVTFDAPPERVMLLESAPVTILDGVGAFDRVISRAGQYPDEYYDDDLIAAVKDIPPLTDQLDASGHLEISQEEVIAQEPDLVLGLPDGLSRETLADAGINVLVQELYCPNSSEDATFDTLYAEVERYGEVFGHESQAADLQKSLEQRVQAVEEQELPDGVETAAVLYPSQGSGPMYTYGTGSMAAPQLQALGLENVFGDNSERVFEIQTEALIDADPDVIVVLYQGDEKAEQEIFDAVATLPGAQDISAFQQDRVITQLFNFTEPASPLTIQGLELLSAELVGSDS